jgi:tRNA(Ile)-lysidine synthase
LTSGVKLTLAQFERDATFQPSKEQHLVHVDGGKVRFPLTVRRVQEGDWFVPFGMTGRKLVSDFLTDRKVNLLDKRKALVVCDATNAVVWLVGYRTDNRFRVSDETESVLIIHSST